VLLKKRHSTSGIPKAPSRGDKLLLRAGKSRLFGGLEPVLFIQGLIPYRHGFRSTFLKIPYGIRKNRAMRQAGRDRYSY